MKLTELIKCLGNPEEITLLDYPRSRVSFLWAKVGRVKLIAMTRPRQWRRWLIGNLLVQSNRAEGYLSGIAGKETASLPGGVLATTNPVLGEAPLLRQEEMKTKALRPRSKRTDADTRLADQAPVSFCDERCPPGKIAWTTLQAKIKEHAQEVQAALNSLK